MKLFDIIREEELINMILYGFHILQDELNRKLIYLKQELMKEYISANMVFLINNKTEEKIH